ncbi:MAG: hypothetical protein ABIP81_02525 [Terriglobales bacterium]
MNRPLNPKVHALAQRLLAYEAKAGISSRPAAARVSEKLSRTLNALVGVAGYRSLLSRALTLGNEEVAWLKVVHVNAVGDLEGFNKVKAQLSQAEVARGEVIFIAQLLGLLITFIGEALTLGLLQNAWPKATFDD